MLDYGILQDFTGRLRQVSAWFHRWRYPRSDRASLPLVNLFNHRQSLLFSLSLLHPKTSIDNTIHNGHLRSSPDPEACAVSIPSYTLERWMPFGQFGRLRVLRKLTPMASRFPRLLSYEQSADCPSSATLLVPPSRRVLSRRLSLLTTRASGKSYICSYLSELFAYCFFLFFHRTILVFYPMVSLYVATQSSF